MRLFLIILAALVFAGSASALLGPWQNYVEGNTLCVVDDPMAQRIVMVRLNEDVRVVGYHWGPLTFDSHVPPAVQNFVANQDGYALRRRCW